MHRKYFTSVLASGLIALLCTLPAAAANLAGKAVFVSGKATATDSAGNVRELKARDEVYSGDLLETGKGRIQIKLLDGAFMSIQPNSRFKIEDYNYANESDGSEKAVYNLFKGGMRAFTGAIGKKHPDAYKVKTPVATIGIRGTGHNTRVCSGDCTGSNGLPLPDGLYHSTWEGTTYVDNDTGTSEVPFGNSVYVKSIDTPAEQTNEASEVTAVQPSEETVEELVEEQEEQVTLELGDEVTSTGIPTGLQPNPISSRAGLNLVSIEPDLADEDGVGIGLLFETTAFFGPTGPVGAFGTDVNDGPPGLGTLATIDPLSIEASTNPLAAEARALISDARANPANDALFSEFLADPASIAEFTEDSGIGYGSWANGKVLIFNTDGSVSLTGLTDDQRLHYIFGNSPAVPTAGAVGSYEFTGGTNSTTTSGNAVNGVSIGEGATSGSLTFDFDNMTGTVAMTVSHGLIYTIEGPLLIDVVFPSLFADNGTMATTTSGNCAQGGCTAFIEGSFFGPLVLGGPAGAGLEYDIQDSGDVITGVAAYNNVTATDPPPPPPPPPPPAELIMIPNQTLIGAEPNLYPATEEGNAGAGIVFDSTVLVGADSVGTNGTVGVVGMELDSDELFTLLVTIDPNGIRDISEPNSAVAVAQGFINDALDGGGPDADTVNAVIADPAKVAEYTVGTHLGSNYALARWTDGMVLFIDENIEPGSPDFGVVTVEADDLALVNQSFYTGNGDTPDTEFGLGATGTYNLLATTASTTTHSGGLGSGVQSGSLAFDFTTLNGTIAMEILQGATYLVNGALQIDPDSPGDFFDVPYGVWAVADDLSCGEGACETLIEGSFFGPLAGTDGDGAPVLAGLDYEIITTPFDTETPMAGDSIIGNAVFGRDGPADPIPSVIPGQGLLLALPVQVEGNYTAAIGMVSDATNIVGGDSMNNPGFLTIAGTQNTEGTDFFGIASIDPEGLLAIDSTDQNVLDAQDLVTAAMTGSVEDQAAVDAVIANPATVAEFFQGDGFAFARWADGNVLSINSPAEVFTLVDNQSLHIITGDTPDMPASGATGTYEFIGGTQSTSFSGDSIGLGVTSGTLTFDFDNLSGTINMVVNHLTDYNVAGDLGIDNIANVGSFFDTGATATTSGGNCDLGCDTFIDGGFAGGLSGGAEASPAFAGLEYDIDDPVDGIMGVAAFGRTGDGPVVISQ